MFIKQNCMYRYTQCNSTYALWVAMCKHKIYGANEDEMMNIRARAVFFVIRAYDVSAVSTCVNRCDRCIGHLPAGADTRLE